MDFSTALTFLKTSISSLSGMQSAEVLKERIAFINDQMDMLKEAHAATQNELSEAKIKIVELEEQVATYREAEQFVQYKGAFFRKDPSGGYIDAVYCPNCRIQVGCTFPEFPFICNKCKWSSSFTGRNFSFVFRTIP